MLKEMAHFAAFMVPTLVRKWTMEPARLHEILVAREDRAGMGERRRTLARPLRGRVLEIGCGAGGLFPHYPSGARVTAVEPDPALRAKARRRARDAAASIQVVPGVGEALPFGDSSFDEVVGCMVLCSVSEPDRVLSEARRVLRPGGGLHLMEHVRSESPWKGALLDRLNPVWQFLYRTRCNVNRSLDAALARERFLSGEEVRFRIFCRGVPALPMKLIRARKAGAGHHRRPPVPAPGGAPSRAAHGRPRSGRRPRAAAGHPTAKTSGRSAARPRDSAP